MSKQTANDLPIDRLNGYLGERIENFGTLVRAEKFSEGQSNPTYLLVTDQQRYVLRKKPDGPVLPSAHAVDREFRVMSALSATPVPVPAMHLLCEDESVIGTCFYVMDFVEGQIHVDAQLRDVTPANRRSAMYEQMNQVLAALHSVDTEAVGLTDYGRPGNYFERQLNRWTKQYRASETEHIEAMEQLMAWLPEQMPADDGRVSLIHGDFRLDNMMFADDQNGQPQVVALLDWELSTLGHPFSDLAYQCMQWRAPADPALGNLSGLHGIDRAALGIPTEEEYIARYCQRMGLSEIPNWPFYLAFSFFRFVAILQGIMKRYQEGNASSTQALTYGQLARPMAELAIDYLHGEQQL